jgi:hypothetical protein
MTSIPAWGVVHVPHDSRDIPAEIRSQFVLNESALDMEIHKMTDHLTYALFAEGLPSAQVVRSSVSHLVYRGDYHSSNFELEVEICLRKRVKST